MGLGVLLVHHLMMQYALMSDPLIICLDVLLGALLYLSLTLRFNRRTAAEIRQLVIQRA